MTATRPPSASPTWLDEAQYPFEPHFFKTASGAMHYVDEGHGDVILLVHGNPTWSFMFRHLIAGLRDSYRCIAIDHIGFGLSDKPADASYLPQFHAANLKAFIEGLGLERITLVLHDWGGAIGMSYALDNPENVERIVAFNNSFWSVKGVKAAERFSKIVGGPIGWIACHLLNAFPRFVIPSVFGDKSKLSKSVHKQYIRAFPTISSRKSTWVLAKSIIRESDWLANLWDRRAAVRDKALLLLIGKRDPTFGPDKQARWEDAFPRHRTISYLDVGHFVPEELGREAVTPVREFMSGARHDRSEGSLAAMGSE